MGRLKKAQGFEGPKFLCIRMMALQNLETGWAISTEALTEFARVCIEKEGNFSPAEFHSWTKKIDHPPDNLQGFISLIMSIKKEGFKYAFDNLEKYRKSGELPEVPRVTEGLNLDDGRHRVAALRALGVTVLPMYVIRIEKVKREHQLVGKSEAFCAETLAATELFVCSRQWYDYRRTSAYRMCSKAPVEKEIPPIYSRKLTKAQQKKPKRRWFRRKKK